MSLLAEYQDARRSEVVARLRSVITLRAMNASGMTQRQIAELIGMSQSTVGRQLRSETVLEAVHPEVLLKAATPVLRSLADELGYRRMAVFGSVARGEARKDSDIDLVVDAPPGTSSFEFVRFRLMLEKTLGREIDLISYGGLRPMLDDVVRRDAVLL